MRDIPRHLRLKPYNRAKEAQQHRIAIGANLSPLEADLAMYVGMPPPHTIRYPDGHYEYETQHS